MLHIKGNKSIESANKYLLIKHYLKFQRNNNKRNISMILLRTKKKKGEKK